MANRPVGALAAVLLGLLAVGAAQSEPLRILYAEPFRLQSSQATGLQKPGPQSARVEAFGRALQLVLEDNNRLLRAASPQARQRLSSSRLFRGSISGVPGSWVRLTLTEGAYRGAIWDGSDLYLVEPRATVEEALIVPLAGAAQASAIYRLSDTQGGAFHAACGVDSSATERTAPLANYGALVRELQAAASTAPREIEVAIVGDFEFTSRNGFQSLTKMLGQVNVVDGIFSEQVGVAIIPTDFITFATDTDPFTGSNPVTLLEQLGEFRAETPAIRSRGLAHLMTGRPLSGNVIGIAYLGALCETNEGVGLSEVSYRYDTPLIMAHELGHNFGAPHDAEAGSACASTPPGFVMEPQLNFSSTFSVCSVQRMQPPIAGAACVVPARTRDVAVNVPAGEIQAFPNTPFDFAVDFASVGDTAAANATLTVTVPSGLQVQSFAMSGGQCRATTGGTFVCELAELPAGESRRLTARMNAPADGEFLVRASGTSTNDASSANDTQTVRVSVVTGRDFQVTVAPQPLTVAKGDTFEMTFDIAAADSRTLSDVRVAISHGGLQAVSATLDTGSCTLPGSTPPNVSCTLPSLVPGTPRRIRAEFRATSLSSGTVGGQVRVYEAANQGGQRFTPFVVQTVASRDIVVTTSSPNNTRVAIGSDAVWNVDVRSVGINPANDVTIEFTHSSLSSQVTVNVDPPVGSTCTRNNAIRLTCTLGTMTPGASQTLRVRAQAAEETDVHVNTRAMLAGSSDDDFQNDRLTLNTQVRFGSDVGLQSVSGTAAFDDSDATLQATIKAFGVSASENIVVTTTLPPGLRVVSAQLGPHACVPQATTPNVVACTLAQLAPESTATVAVRYRADAPGQYAGGQIAVTADTDLQPANNSQSLTFTIAPFINGELIGPSTVPSLRSDVPTDIVFTVKTNNRTLPDARVDFSWTQLTDVVAIVPGVTCVATPNGRSCPLGTLPPNSNVPITLRARGVTRSIGFLNALLVATADTAPADNGAFLIFEIFDPGDAAVVLSDRTVTNGERTSLGFNVNITAEVYAVALEFDYDESRIVDLSPVMGCNVMTSPHRCEISPNLTPRTLAVEMAFTPVGTGAVPITVRVRSFNDANASNDVATATITINAAAPTPPSTPPATPPSSPPSSGGGGGGGPIEWPLALMLALLWLMRSRAAIRAG